MRRQGDRAHAAFGHGKSACLAHATRRRRLDLLLAAALAVALVPANPTAADPSPVVAGLASLVLPGGGQFVNGDTEKGLLFLGGTATAVVLGGTLAFVTALGGGGRDQGVVEGLFIAGFGLWVWSVGDAVVVADRRRRAGQKASASAMGPLPEEPGVRMGFGLVQPEAPGVLVQARF